MNKRPIAVAVAAILLVIAGLFGLVGAYLNFKSLSANHYGTLWIGAVNLIGVLDGVFILRGYNWARWLAVAWMAFHVAISFFNSIQEVLVHSILLALIAWCLFRGAARAYFSNRSLST
ncbi:MAG TPA: hypothetical protein VGJ21_23375 [Terracidiphilus sp.]|jgi:hypothetical protein